MLVLFDFCLYFLLLLADTSGLKSARVDPVVCVCVSLLSFLECQMMTHFFCAV